MPLAAIAQPAGTADKATTLVTGQAHVRAIVEVVSAIKSNYVDRVDDSALLTPCTYGIEAWSQKRGIPLSGRQENPQVVAPLDRLRNLFRGLQSQPLELVDWDNLVEVCLAPMLSGLDQRSEYLNRQGFDELQRGTPPSMGGIGLELTREGEYTRIVSIIEGTPAARSDLQADDVIQSINATSVKGMALRNVVNLTRGKPGTQIVLTIVRQGVSEPIRLELTREVIRVETVNAKMLEGGLLYVRIAMFQQRTLERFASALQFQYQRDPQGISGVILDVRDNPGGLLYSCVGVAAAFLPESALVVELKGRIPESNHQFLARPADYARNREAPLSALPASVKTVPLVILVNRGSSACSEILASAMQDHRRAKVIGGRTAGLGTVQTIMPLGNNTAIKLTTARFFRPNGSAVESNPVTPDVAIDSGERANQFGTANDLVLTAARGALLEPR
jgi:carboxyl-terminal processing protease